MHCTGCGTKIEITNIGIFEQAHCENCQLDFQISEEDLQDGTLSIIISPTEKET